MPSMETAPYKEPKWLDYNYNTLGLSTYEIAKQCGVDPKTIWTWLKKYDLNKRPRTWNNKSNVEVNPYQDRDWLISQYVVAERSSRSIANDFGITDANILYWLKRHGIKRRTAREVRDAYTYRKMQGADNPMFGKKGPLSSNWKGGTTPERQAFYQSDEWKSAVSKIWKRDLARCRRCGIERTTMAHHIHHIKSFSTYPDLRSDLDNLVLLCAECHRWVHSKNNVKSLFIQGGDANE